jgi:hypothetical protein
MPLLLAADDHYVDYVRPQRDQRFDQLVRAPIDPRCR